MRGLRNDMKMIQCRLGEMRQSAMYALGYIVEIIFPKNKNEKLYSLICILFITYFLFIQVRLYHLWLPALDYYWFLLIFKYLL